MFKKVIMKNSVFHTKNRYYYRGSSPSGVDTPSCNNNDSNIFSLNYGNDVLSRNNPYSNDNPSFSDYLVYSNFEYRVLSNEDIMEIVKRYNNGEKDYEKLFGPFTQRNLNIASETYYNSKYWDKPLGKTFVPSSFPVLYQTAYSASLEFAKAMNNIMPKWAKIQKFQMAKNKIIRITRSPQTEFLKYMTNIALMQNTKSKFYVFEVSFYYDPNKNKLYKGKAVFIGSGTTDSLLLPKGESSRIFEDVGRPLHPLHSEDYQMIPESEANEIYRKYLNSVTKYYEHKDDIPFWHKSRHGKEEKPSVKTGYGTISSMFPDNHPNDTKCFLHNHTKN